MARGLASPPVVSSRRQRRNLVDYFGHYRAGRSAKNIQHGPGGSLLRAAVVCVGIFALVFFAAFAATTLYVAIGVWGSIAWALLAPYVLVVVSAAWLTAPHVRQVVRFERREGGQLYYRLPWVIPVLSLVLFVARLGIEVVVFGISSLFNFTLPTSLPIVLLAILVGFDLLYGASLGLLFGRGIGIRRAHQDLGGAEDSPVLPPLVVLFRALHEHPPRAVPRKRTERSTFATHVGELAPSHIAESTR